MSVIVMGMEIPDNCYACPFVRTSWGSDYYCAKGNGTEDNIRVLMRKRMADCPLIDIPTPHGRLIDADALLNKTFYNPLSPPYITKEMVLGEKIVIEAEGSEE